MTVLHALCFSLSFLLSSLFPCSPSLFWICLFFKFYKKEFRGLLTNPGVWLVFLHFWGNVWVVLLVKRMWRRSGVSWLIREKASLRQDVWAWLGPCIKRARVEGREPAVQNAGGSTAGLITILPTRLPQIFSRAFVNLTSRVSSTNVLVANRNMTPLGFHIPLWLYAFDTFLWMWLNWAEWQHSSC